MRNKDFGMLALVLGIHFSLPSLTRERGHVPSLLSQPELNPRANNRYTSLCKTKSCGIRTLVCKTPLKSPWPLGRNNNRDGSSCLPNQAIMTRHLFLTRIELKAQQGTVEQERPELNPRANNRYTSLCKKKSCRIRTLVCWRLCSAFFI